MSTPSPPSASSSSNSPTPSSTHPRLAATRRRPSSQYSRRSIVSFRTPPSLSPTSTLAGPTVTLSHSTLRPRQEARSTPSSFGSSSTSEMKRALEADEATRLRMEQERREQQESRKGKGREVVGLPTEFGGEGGGEAGIFLGKRRKVQDPVATPEDVGKGTGTAEGPVEPHPTPTVSPPLPVPPDPATVPQHLQFNSFWFGTWSRTPSGALKSSTTSSGPSSTESPALEATHSRAAHPSSALPTVDQSPDDVASSSPKTDYRSTEIVAVDSTSRSAAVASAAFAWIPKPVVSTVAALPVVRSYAGRPTNVPSPSPTTSSQPLFDSSDIPKEPRDPVNTPVQLPFAAVHEGHLPGQVGSSSWFWSNTTPVKTILPHQASESTSPPSPLTVIPPPPSQNAPIGPSTAVKPTSLDATSLQVLSTKPSWFSLRSYGGPAIPNNPPEEKLGVLGDTSLQPTVNGPVPDVARTAAFKGDEEVAQSPQGGGSWWSYVPLVGEGSRPAPLESVSEVPSQPVQGPPPLQDESASVLSSVPPPPTTSYLAPLSWIYTTATTSRFSDPTQPVVEPAPTSSAPAPPAPMAVPSKVPATKGNPTSSSSSPVPSPKSYSTWLTSVASKAVQPRSDVKTIGLGADVGEVMDIEGMEEEQPGLPGSRGSREGLQPPRNRSPPSSVRLKKSSSFFFSALSKSPSSSSLVGQKMSPSTVSAAESLRAASSRRPSSIKALPPPNLVLPSFDDVFKHAPRSTPPPSSSRKGLAKKTLTVLGSMLGGEKEARGITPSEERIALGRERGRVLPKTLSLVTGQKRRKGIRKVVILGVHGWFPTGLTRRIAGEPTGTSIVFANKMRTALERYLGDEPIEALESLTVIPLEGDGTVRFRVDKLFEELTGNDGWVKDLREADAIFVGTHSQGCPVSTHLLAKLFDEGYIRSPHNTSAVYQLDDILKSTSLVDSEYPKVAFLGLCGVHSGPLTTLSQSSVVMPYIQYFENAAAHELFDFQDTESETSKSYIASLTTVLDHGCKMVFVASLNDQVVPVYSAIFSAAHHPNILRVLHIDGAAYDVSDFVTNLLVFCLQLRNAGLDDGGLVSHLSESVAHGLTGVGHSTAYVEDASYSLVVRYLFETGDSPVPKGSLHVDEFLASEHKNSYEVPWILRGIMEDPLVLELFGAELNELRSGFDKWVPQTQKMKDLRRKLEPLRLKQSRRSTIAPSPLASEINPASPPATVNQEKSSRSKL